MKATLNHFDYKEMLIVIVATIYGMCIVYQAKCFILSYLVLSTVNI